MDTFDELEYMATTILTVVKIVIVIGGIIIGYAIISALVSGNKEIISTDSTHLDKNSSSGYFHNRHLKEQSTKFKNLTDLMNWTKLFLYAQVVISIISIISGIFEYQYIVRVFALIISIISGILILTWIYSANYNAHQLEAKEMVFTPGWSVGWYFVPIANLWKPYQAMIEIWKISSNPQSWKSQSVSSLLPWWWFLWVVFNMASFMFPLMPWILIAYNLVMSSKSSFNTGDINAFMLPIDQIIGIITIALSFIVIVIINRIHKMQISHALTE